MNTYLENVKSGKNTWKAYVFTITSVVAGISIGGLIISLLVPFLKSIFPEGDLGKQLGTFVIIGVTFGFGLIGLLIAFKKFHQRSIMSLINIQKKFSFSLYLKGFLAWGVLLFLVNMTTDFQDFKNFISNFNLANFILLAVVGFIFIGIQSFFEEILIRGYILQGISLRVKKTFLLIAINSIIFGLLHLGYGIESFISATIVGLTSILIILKQNRIEFVAGVHNANNLILSLVFIDLNEAVNEEFSWSIDWTYLSLDILISIILITIVYKFIK